jgi:hypothetical protein
MADIISIDGDGRPPRGGEGGAGGQRPDLATLRLETMALRQYHDVPPEMIRRMLENVDRILKTSKSTRAQIAAGKLLLELGRLNLSAIYAVLMARQREGVEWPAGMVPEIQIPDCDARFKPKEDDGGDDGGTDD